MEAKRQRDPETLRVIVGASWSPRGLAADEPGGDRKRYITRTLAQEHGRTCGCSACTGRRAGACATMRFEEMFEPEKKQRMPRPVAGAQEFGRDPAVGREPEHERRVNQPFFSKIVSTVSATHQSDPNTCCSLELQSRRTDGCEHNTT